MNAVKPRWTVVPAYHRVPLDGRINHDRPSAKSQCCVHCTPRVRNAKSGHICRPTLRACDEMGLKRECAKGRLGRSEG